MQVLGYFRFEYSKMPGDPIAMQDSYSPNGGKGKEEEADIALSSNFQGSVCTSGFIRRHVSGKFWSAM